MAGIGMIELLIVGVIGAIMVTGVVVAVVLLSTGRKQDHDGP
jgi:hypothetical protein